MTEGETEVLYRSWPTNLSEFVQEEIDVASEGLDIHQHNQSQIEGGNKDLEEIYGGVEGAGELVKFSRDRLEKFERARDELEQDNKKSALVLLEEEIEELNRLANENLRLGGLDFAKVQISRINLLRKFREK
jgi:hypothetical protein